MPRRYASPIEQVARSIKLASVRLNITILFLCRVRATLTLSIIRPTFIAYNVEENFYRDIAYRCPRPVHTYIEVPAVIK